MTEEHPSTEKKKKHGSQGHLGTGSSGKHLQVLVPNTVGRLVFLSLALALLVTVALGIVSMTQGNGAWQLKAAVGLQTLGLFLVIFATTSITVFRFHRLNFLIAVLLMIGVSVFEWLLASSSGGDGKSDTVFAHVSNIGGAVIMLISGLLLVIPSSMSAAQNFHPFIVSSKKRKPSSPTQVKQVHSIFEDWPEPVPFPVTTLYTFNTSSESELAFAKNQNLMVLDCRGNWWQARDMETAKVGFIPSNFVQVLQKAKVVKRHLAASDDEASVQEGQVVEVMEHHEFLSLVRTVEGRIGSVPTSCLELIPDTALEKLKV